MCEKEEERKKTREKREVKIWKKNLVVDCRSYPVRGRGNGCPRLKSFKYQEKKCHTNICDLKICINRCVCIEFQRRGTQFELRLECIVRLKALVSNEP